MDPNACLLRLRHARYDGDHEEVLLASLDLRRWVDDGGSNRSGPKRNANTSWETDMADHSTKDKQMASNLKARGEERTSCRCPMCHVVIALTKLYGHLSCHGGATPRGSA